MPLPIARLAWVLAAIALIGLALAQLLGPVWNIDPRGSVPTAATLQEVRLVRPERSIDAMMSDLRFVVFATAQASRALLDHPLAIFEAPQCFPARRSLAYGHPLIGFGLLGLPAMWLTGDPILTYNVALVAVLALGALAMAWLVRDWTGEPAAALTAGLIYGFYASKVMMVTWPFMTDTGWTVLALLFGRRFFARGRWRDGLATALCCVLQLSVSFYAVLATAFIAPAMAVWLFAAYGTRALRRGPVLASLALLVVGGAVLYAPYLQVRAAHDTLHAATQVFAPWSALLPGGVVGRLASVLLLVGVALPAARTTPEMPVSPRWALLAAIATVALLGTGGNAVAQHAARVAGESVVSIPSLYAGLSALLPGLDSVRLPGTMLHGVHLCASIGAGLGAAGLLRLVPRPGRLLAGAALVALAFVVTVRPPWLGLPPQVQYGRLHLRPPPEALRFFESLEALGNRGPLLELPMNLRSPAYLLMDSSAQMLLTTYHGRPTSGCYNSYVPPERRAVAEQVARLPRRDALQALRDMGFTTLVAHHPPPDDPPPVARMLARAAERPGAALHRIHGSASYTAYGIELDPRP